MTVREDTYEYRGQDTYSTADTFDYIHMITGRHYSTGDRKEYTGNMSRRVQGGHYSTGRNIEKQGRHESTRGYTGVQESTGGYVGVQGRH